VNDSRYYFDRGFNGLAIGIPIDTEADDLSRSFGRETHGGDDVRHSLLPRTAGGTGRNSDSFEIQRDHEVIPTAGGKSHEQGVAKRALFIRFVSGG
jgi:hypothetical protein